MTYIMTDGSNTKSINPWDLEANPDAWTWITKATDSEIDSMFYKVAASFRAVNKRAIAAANVPFQILKGETVVDDSAHWENAVKFMPKPKDLLRRISLSLTFHNKAYLLRGRDVLKQQKGLNFLVPTSVREITNPVTGQLDYFERIVNGVAKKYAPDDPDLIKIWLLDSTTELLPSKNTAAQAILNSTGSIYFADLFIKNFYERGGVKPTVLAFKGAIFKGKEEDIERGWTRFLKNLSRFSAKIFNAETMDIKPIGAGVDDLKNNEIYRQAIENIALGIGMPVSELLSDFDSFATAQIDRMSWQRDDIFPHVEAIAEDLNIQVFNPLGLHLDFLTETSDAETQDEVDRAKAYEIYTTAGIKPSVAAQMVGIELPEGVEYDALDAMMEEKKKEEEAKQKAEADRLAAQQAEKQPKPASQPAAKWIPSLAEYKELDVWSEVAMRKLKKNESLDFDYEPHYGGLPEELTASIKSKLAQATTADEIKAAFVLDLTETRTPAPEYKSSEILVLADALNNYAKSTTTDAAKEPVIVINNSQKAKKVAPIAQIFAKTAFTRKGE